MLPTCFTSIDVDEGQTELKDFNECEGLLRVSSSRSLVYHLAGSKQPRSCENPEIVIARKRSRRSNLFKTVAYRLLRFARNDIWRVFTQPRPEAGRPM